MAIQGKGYITLCGDLMKTLNFADAHRVFKKLVSLLQIVETARMQFRPPPDV